MIFGGVTRRTIKEMAMRYGAMNFPIKPVVDEIQRIAGLGFDYLELAMDPPMAHYSNLKELKDLKGILRASSLGLVCHLPTFVYTADLTESIRQASLDEMLKSIETIAGLGAEKAVLHPPIINGLGPFVMEQSRAFSMESIGEIVQKAKTEGITLCLENMFPAYNSFYTPEEFSHVFGQFPDLFMTLDVAHAHIGTQGAETFIRYIKMFGERIRHIHVSDNCGKRDDHLLLGSGTIDFVRIASTIRDSGYDETVTFEIFSPYIRDLVGSREHFHKLVS